MHASHGTYRSAAEIFVKVPDPFTSSTSPLTCFTIHGTGAPMSRFRYVTPFLPTLFSVLLKKLMRAKRPVCLIKSFSPVYSGLLWSSLLSHACADGTTLRKCVYMLVKCIDVFDVITGISPCTGTSQVCQLPCLSTHILCIGLAWRD